MKSTWELLHEVAQETGWKNPEFSRTSREYGGNGNQYRQALEKHRLGATRRVG